MEIAKLFLLQGNTQKGQRLNATHFYFISNAFFQRSLNVASLFH